MEARVIHLEREVRKWRGITITLLVLVATLLLAAGGTKRVERVAASEFVLVDVNVARKMTHR